MNPPPKKVRISAQRSRRIPRAEPHPTRFVTAQCRLDLSHGLDGARLAHAKLDVPHCEKVRGVAAEATMTLMAAMMAGSLPPDGPPPRQNGSESGRGAGLPLHTAAEIV